MSARAVSLGLWALWGKPFQVAFVEGLSRSAFRERSLRLPGSDEAALNLARATHAALHAELSPVPFEPRQLKPMQRALFGVLEDARVEALAVARYPGLRDVWAPFHLASPALGESVPALLGRLSRALFDPSYQDPNAWVRRAVVAFSAAGQASAQSARELASVLGNELGQLRLPFDPAAPSTEPLYRDDHTGLWRLEPEAAQESAETAPDARREGSGAGAAEAEPGSEVPITHRYPEWDYRIERERPDHVAVREQRREPSVVVAVPTGVLRRARAVLRRAHRPERPRPRCADGKELDLNAVVRDAAERARGGGGDVRLYRGHERCRLRSSTLLLLDLSASLAEPELARLQAVSVALAASLPPGAELAIDGFCSRGREDVGYERFKEFEAPPAALAPARSRAGSTRLGAALRHATARLGARSAPFKLLLVLSDVDPADVDVFDERYLQEDAWRACRAARARGVRLFAGRVGGARSPLSAGLEAQALPRLTQLPRVLFSAYSPRRSGRGGESRV